jgi:glycosyltransferase involved in cell wall biosynthesis
MPRVSVIIATYNWATVLPYSIGSVLDQTFEDFELLVIGDGCTDESGEIVEAIDDPRVRWHNLPVNTKHQTGPNNEGLRLACGEVIAYLGHDDLWLPHHLEVLLEAVDDGASMVVSSYLAVAPHKRPTIWPDDLGRKLMHNSSDFAKARHARKDRFTELSKMIPPSSVVHDLQLAVEVGGWRWPRDTGVLAPQADLWNRMMSRVGRPRRWVRRITCVKIAASSRPGVYRNRPWHEQAYWLQRIRESDDPEETMRRAGVEDYVFAQPDGLGEFSALRVGSGIAAFTRRVREQLARRGIVSPPPPVSADEYLRSIRRYKGLRD